MGKDKKSKSSEIEERLKSILAHPHQEISTAPEPLDIPKGRAPTWTHTPKYKKADLGRWKWESRLLLTELACLLNREEPPEKPLSCLIAIAAGEILPDISPKSKITLQILERLDWSKYTDKITYDHGEPEIPAAVGFTVAKELGITIPDELKMVIKDDGLINELKGEVRGLVGSDHIMDQEKGPNTAKQKIFEYAERIKRAGNPLKHADFNDPIQDETIISICESEKDGLSPDTLRRYLSDAKLLAPSKRGRKPKNGT